MIISQHAQSFIANCKVTRRTSKNEGGPVVYVRYGFGIFATLIIVESTHYDKHQHTDSVKAAAHHESFFAPSMTTKIIRSKVAQTYVLFSYNCPSLLLRSKIFPTVNYVPVFQDSRKRKHCVKETCLQIQRLLRHTVFPFKKVNPAKQDF